MFATTLIASVVVGLAQAGSGLSCPVTGEAISGSGGKSFDYSGARYTVCCAGCVGAFKKDPSAALSSDKIKGKVVGVSLFDPTTGVKVDAKKSKSFSDYNGLRYYFASADGKKAFDAEPKKFATAPKKEALHCPVMNHGIDSYEKAGAYVDHEGVRYYVCCPGCLGQLQKEPAKYAPNAKAAVKAPTAMDAPKK